MAKLEPGAASTLVVGNVITIFTQFMPNLREVRKADPTEDTQLAGDVRLGEVASAGVVLAVGAVASSLSESSTPLMISVGLAILLILLFESALRADTPFEGYSGEADTNDDS